MIRARRDRRPAFPCRESAMRSRTVIATAVMICCVCATADAQRVFAPRRLCEADEAQIDACLRAQEMAQPDPARRLSLWAAANVGQPCAAREPADEKREIRTGQATLQLAQSGPREFVEQTCALALTPDYASAGKILPFLRYRAGVISLEARNHYPMADWARNNAWLFQDITKQLGKGMAWIPAHRVLRRAADLRARYDVEVPARDEKFLDCFIPRVYLYKVLSKLQDGDLAIFITGNDREQRGSGVGIIRRQPNGKLTVVYAASPAAREEPLMNTGSITAKRTDIIGYKFLRLRPGAAERARSHCRLAVTPARRGN
jgi:hypothetical protein